MGDWSHHRHHRLHSRPKTAQRCTLDDSLTLTLKPIPKSIPNPTYPTSPNAETWP